MTATETDTLIYYRPEHNNAELLTSEQAILLEKLYGKDRPYNIIKTIREDQNYGTGLHIVTELMAVIQCNRHLNERDDQLRNRILSGLIRSSGRDAQYGSMSEFVEQNLLFKLLQDARDLFLKEGGSTDCKSYETPVKEFFRLYGLPYNSIVKKMNEHNDVVKNIPKPVKLYKIKTLTDEYVNDQTSTYQMNTVKAQLSHSFDDKKREIYKLFPYVGKVHKSFFGEGHMQLYVNDYAGRDWAMQNVIHYLVTKGYVKLNSKEFFM